MRVLHHALLLVVVYVLTFLTNLPDWDLWARLAVGSIFFQTGHVPRHDIFSYLPTKSLWIDHEWGTGVVLYGAARYLGEHGVFLVKAVLIYLIFIVVLKTIKTREGKKPVSILYCAFLGYALFPGIASLVRSQMFTYLFFAVWLYGLENVRLGRKRILWVFPSTMLLWVNVHGGFVAGIGIVVLYLIGESLNRKDPRPYVWIALSILPVTLINPYGFGLWRYIVEASLLPRPFIPEWHPLSLSGPMQVIGGVKVHFLMGYMVLVGLTWAVAGQSIARKEKPDWTRIILVVVLFFLSVRHQRHAMFFVLAVAVLLHDRFDGLLDPLRRIISKTCAGRASQVHTVARYGLGYVLPAIVLAGIVPRLSHRMVVDYERYPVGSLAFVKQNGVTGNLATAFDWGSYALWKLYPQCRILIDGRYEEVYPNEVFASAMRFSEKQARWWEVLRRYPTDVVVLSKHAYQQTDLSLLPDWKFVYQDAVSVVLLPKDKTTGRYVIPDYRDAEYSREDLARPVPYHHSVR